MEIRYVFEYNKEDVVIWKYVKNSGEYNANLKIDQLGICKKIEKENSSSL